MSKVAVIGLVGNSAFLSVDKFHEGGETVVAKDIHFEPGGKGFNQAVSAARMGAEVSFLGAVGNDYFKDVMEFCKQENISAYIKVKEEKTAYASIITDSFGENRVTVYQGAFLSRADVECFEKEIERAHVLLINNEVPEDVNVEAVKVAKKHGTKVIFNPAPSRKICPYLLENTDLFTPNEFEASALENRENLVITLGSKGCLIKELKKTLPAFSVGSVVDTTGAGDTFNGVFATLLGDGFDVEKAASISNVAAAISVTKKYAVSSIPTKEEVLNAIAE